MSFPQGSKDWWFVEIQSVKTKTQMKFKEAPTARQKSTKCKSFQLLIASISVYKDLSDNYSQYEKWLASFIQAMDTDVMPGS